MSDNYKHIKNNDNYIKLLLSGMFWEFHPELSGDWEKDKEKIKTMKNKDKTAVQWLETRFLSGLTIKKEDFDMAKNIEKKQHENTWNKSMNSDDDFEKFFSETYLD